MFITVKFAVNVGVLDPKVGAEIQNARAGGKQRLGKFGSESVRQRQEDNCCSGRDCFRLEIGKLERGRFRQVGDSRKNFGKRSSYKLPRGCGHKIDIRMSEQPPDEFFTRVTGSADN